jgi:hypothetical protein
MFRHNFRYFTRMLRSLILSLILLLSYSAYAQKSIRYFIPIDIHAGVSLARIESTPLANVSTKPDLAFSAFSGLMLTYKDKFGFAGEGGLVANGYSYTNSYQFAPNAIAQSSAYSIAHYTFSTKARAFYLINLKNNRHSVLRIGLGAGYLFMSSEQKFATVGSMSILTAVKAGNIPFIEPEIGLTKLLGKNQFDLGLTYHHNYAVSDLFTSRITTATGSANAFTRLNYLAVIVRFHPEILRKRKASPDRGKPQIIRIEPELAQIPEFDKRTSRERVTLDLKHKKAVLKFKDNSEIDGDTISVYVNGLPILIDYGLVKKEKKIRIELNPGENKITVVAKNEGKVPPNTATCRIRSGLKTYQLTTSTSMRQNEVIKLNFKP